VSEEHKHSSADNARLAALASRIAEIDPSWLPIVGHVRNVTFTLDEADLVIAALTSTEPQTLPKRPHSFIRGFMK
jgi:hypothetical protein